MSDELGPPSDPDQPMVYQIRLKGHVGSEWADWFGGLSITLEGNGDTLLTGPVIDQAALHGLLKKVRDLGMPLVSVTPVEPAQGNRSEVKPSIGVSGSFTPDPNATRRHQMNTTKESRHGTNRKTAVIVGVLYIVGTVAGILSAVVTQPILNAPDYLTRVSADPNPIVLGALLVLTMGFALAMVPVFLFPILKRHNEVLALGYVVFRGALETVGYISMVITWLFLIVVGQEYGTTGAAGAAYLQTVGSVLQKGHDSITTVVILVFSLNALMLYYLFYRSNLIPRWISVWGFIAITLHLATGFLIIFHLQSPFSTMNAVMDLPIAIQEMVMAVWLIVKGFNRSAIASGSVR